MLDRKQSIPYELELRDTIDSCLYRLDQLEAAAAECVRLARDMAPPATAKPETFAEKARTQTRLFDNLDLFLAAYARVSLLIFPTGGGPFTKDRGATMQHCLKLEKTSVLNDRALRDAWMHHDERLDTNVAGHTHSGGQLFKLATEVTDANRRGFLRIIEIDTLKVHYHDRDGVSKVADLKAIRGALEALNRTRINAFDSLPI